MLTNSSLPLDSAKTRLYFRNNQFYTGAIGTHVTQGSSDGSSIYARLGFYTFATSSPSSCNAGDVITMEAGHSFTSSLTLSGRAASGNTVFSGARIY
ncbi:hypothetical protein [Ferruginibacter sp. HRS2-29]|uniref:hypothetical protein n=1 Tax=Ferruginibacter sp. HRS2-29 TaxID=2487334 RepID=UPI0020CF0FE8|nr:hypothetical protein [Ferruginibacter sp. HRS2-29]MCP9750157.1 hypothetical protein [Ferruginibacter sp. HRS2-29]